MTILNVRDCSVKEITKESFKGLEKLQYLWVPGNRIERIDDDTFDYVPAVQSIDLRELLRGVIELKVNLISF